ncbi:MAG: hypothetical protein K2G14_00980 [Ruminococcus sp.]|nr:hypothetical protein [Ruminococcus sp.]
MKKFVAICLLCAMSVSVLTSCGKPNLEGRWELCNADGDELDVKIKFTDDGTVKIDGEKGKYELVDKDTVEIKIDGEKYECDFEVVDKDEGLIYISELADKKEQQKIDSIASTLMKASNSALMELDEEDKYYKDKAIICSDSSKSINAVPENAGTDSEFIDCVQLFFNDVDKCEYIIYIEDGYCKYTAVTETSDKKVIGTFPADEFDGMSFDEIYDELKDRIE